MHSTAVDKYAVLNKLLCSYLYSCLSAQSAEVVSEALLIVTGRRHAKRGTGGGEQGGREVERGSNHGIATVSSSKLHQGVWVGVANEDHVTQVKRRSYQLAESIYLLQYNLYNMGRNIPCVPNFRGIVRINS